MNDFCLTKLLFLFLIIAASALGVDTAFSGQRGAILKGGVSQYTPFSTSISVAPIRVDGKNIEGFFSSNFKNGIQPGTHKIVLSVYFIVGFFDRPYRGEIPVIAKLIAGRTYKTVGRIEKRKVSVWIVDAVTQQVSSNIVSLTIKDCPVRIGICLY